MTKFLLSVHVLAAILAIGPITVAASMFPRFVRPRAADEQEPAEHTPQTAAFLHRVCRAYTVVGVVIPVFGLAVGARMGVLTDAWLIASIVLTGIAAALLLVVILPGQERLLTQPTSMGPDTGGTDTATTEGTRVATMRLAMATGVFNLLWATIVVLMIVRPGSTTGA